MLIDFTVENYRSIKEPVTLSAVASTHKANKQDDEITKPFSYPLRKLEILPVLGIFGANASGKSNVLNALGDVLSFCFGLAQERRAAFSLRFSDPFLLNTEFMENPTHFRLRVMGNGNIYIFNLSLNKNQILHESLEYIPHTSKRAVSRLLFTRSWDKKSGNFIIKNGEDFGEKFREIQTSLKDQQTFISLLTGSLKHERTEPFNKWVACQWHSNHVNYDYADFVLACLVLSKVAPDNKKKVVSIMKRFDVGIKDVEIKTLENVDESRNKYEVWVIHKSDRGETKWPLKEESLGTQKLFTLATRLLFSFDTGVLMLVDEFGSSTHPKITTEIVKLFQDRKINKKGAQLIFASHDTNLQRKGLLRRDQIWFTQKLPDGSTDLYPLSDFGVRGDLAQEKAYLDGRFGAVPFLPGGDELRELFEVG